MLWGSAQAAEMRSSRLRFAQFGTPGYLRCPSGPQTSEPRRPFPHPMRSKCSLRIRCAGRAELPRRSCRTRSQDLLVRVHRQQRDRLAQFVGFNSCPRFKRTVEHGEHRDHHRDQHGHADQSGNATTALIVVVDPNQEDEKEDADVDHHPKRRRDLRLGEKQELLSRLTGLRYEVDGAPVGRAFPMALEGNARISARTRSPQTNVRGASVVFPRSIDGQSSATIERM